MKLLTQYLGFKQGYIDQEAEGKIDKVMKKVGHSLGFYFSNKIAQKNIPTSADYKTSLSPIKKEAERLRNKLLKSSVANWSRPIWPVANWRKGCTLHL